jgi:hypothetical protein
MKATHAAYEEESTVTAAVIDKEPLGLDLPGLKIVERGEGGVLVTVPRYAAFQEHALALARQGIAFREIAGNRDVILVAALVPAGWDARGWDVLFTEAIPTVPGTVRVALRVPVKDLSVSLLRLSEPPSRLEHVYDF